MFFLFLLVFFLSFPLYGAEVFQVVPPKVEAKSYLLWDLNANKALTSQNVEERLAIASLTKLMTAYLTFSALHNNKLQLNQPLIVSKNAWQQEGSRMFLNVGATASVDDLLKGMIVQSGNDASVVLAEAIGGSEENFAQLMNLEAKRLGLKNTRFQNATGLPNDNHYSTAEDLALLARALIRDFPEEYQRYYALKEFTYNKIKQPNRNRLLNLDPSVDGMKTGHTDSAGYCLISSAKRDNRRLLAVLLGADSEAKRISESAKLLNWGYGAFSWLSLIEKGALLGEVRVFKGRPQSLEIKLPENLFVLIPKGMESALRFQFKPLEKLVAPLKPTDTVGVVEVYLNNVLYEKHPVLAGQAIPEGGLFERMWDSFLLWRAS